jgi:hypothetical protein
MTFGVSPNSTIGEKSFAESKPTDGSMIGRKITGPAA